MTTATQTHTEETIQVADGTVRVLKGGSGSPLVVIHHDIGNPGWLPAYEALARDFTVYVPEIPGYGQSTRPEWARNLRDLVALMELTCDELGLVDTSSVTLVGLGYGGWIAAEMVSMGQGRYRRLVLVGAAGMHPREGEIYDQFLVSHEDYVKHGFHDLTNFTKQFGELASTDQLVEWDICREMTTRVAWKPYMFNRALPLLLRSVRVPTLLVWGRDDRIVPLVCGQQYAEVLPKAKLSVIERAGHWVEMEQPEELARLVREHAKP